MVYFLRRFEGWKAPFYERRFSFAQELCSDVCESSVQSVEDVEQQKVVQDK